MNYILIKYLIFCIVLFNIQSCNSEKASTSQKPNIVLIFLDDSGFADFQPFAETRYPTPNVDKLAEEGRTFYNFYVPQAICSASRAALMTGTYPGRNGLVGAHAPRERGLDPQFTTLGEILQQGDYRTGFFGKWHMGDQPDTRPQQRGFDEVSGIMYSNDMWADHPVNPEFWGQYPMQYWENDEVAIDSVTAENQENFTTWFTENSVDFINQNSDHPFFLYLAHPMPHVPLFVSDKFKGVSGTGLYGDVIMELDWSVGEVMQALEENGVEDNTIVIFSSDNGPWLTYANHAGKTPYRGEKATSFDGGIRSPLIMKYPGHLEAGSVSLDTFFSIDILPTLVELTGTQLPDNEIDGKNVWNLIVGTKEAENPHEYYPVTMHDELEAIVSGDGTWKLQLPHNYRISEGGRDGTPGENLQGQIDTALFDMIHDPYEKVNVIDDYPEVADKLLNFANMHKEEFFK